MLEAAAVVDAEKLKNRQRRPSKLVGGSGPISYVALRFGQHRIHTPIFQERRHPIYRGNRTARFYSHTFIRHPRSQDTGQSEPTPPRLATHAAGFDPWHPHTTSEATFVPTYGVARNFRPKNNHTIAANHTATRPARKTSFLAHRAWT